ncbi:hypothetical protein [Sulfitobacter sp.]|uniref:hypothetical protein n=1 Tax=Sulfitobacter sp. TaxID=1903071 RepID=UPI00300289D0
MFHSNSTRLPLIIAIAMAAHTASAENLAPLNTLEIIGLSGNEVTAFQTPQSGNIVQISLSGAGNGAPTGNHIADPTWFGTLTPGNISQKGTLQTIVLAVSGNGNLFAISQTGSRNSALGQVSGTLNSAVIQQSGTANRANFVQLGSGNSLSVLQKM